MPNSALPDHLKGKLHWDFPWILSKIPRAWTSYLCVQPPVLLWGNQRNLEEFQGWPDESDYRQFAKNLTEHWNGLDRGPGPIPDPLRSISKWNPIGFCWGLYGVQLRRWMPVLPLGFAFSFKWGVRRVHFRAGFRHDVADSYYTFPTLELSFKKKYD